MRYCRQLVYCLLLPLGCSAPFENPAELTVDSSNILDTVLQLDYGTLTLSGSTINTRLLNGTSPGPTIRVNPGTFMKVLFKNNLVEQATRVIQHNAFQTPDTSNLHFHGPFISGELPSDDVTYPVAPQSEYQYRTTFPDNHLPGTFWIHPHWHGSTTLQVSGGAAAALIVNDPSGFLPTQVENARELVMVIMHFDLEETAEAADESGDQRFSFTGAAQSFLTVSGQVNPEITVDSGEWVRQRVIYAGWDEDGLDMQISLSSGSGSCEMQLLAKDGIYISDYPREITIARIPPGGRADIMVRCQGEGASFQITGKGMNMGVINVNSATVSSTDLQAWAPTYPTYLTDLRNSAAGTGCNCPTALANCNCNNFANCQTALASARGLSVAETFLREVGVVSGRRKRRQAGPGGPPGGGGGPGGGDDDGECINGRPMEMDHEPFHLSAADQVIERELTGIHAHPYHQHTWPFQLISGVSGNDDANSYFRTGDWHDVYMNTQGNPQTRTTMRFVPRVYTGKMMVHCHRLEHEDEGMMGMEYVHGGQCVCDSLHADVVDVEIKGNNYLSYAGELPENTTTWTLPTPNNSARATFIASIFTLLLLR